MAISPITGLLEKCSNNNCGNCEECRPDLVKSAHKGFRFGLRLKMISHKFSYFKNIPSRMVIFLKSARDSIDM